MNIIVTILVVLLVIALIGGLPQWPHSVTYYPNAGYWPSGGAGLAVIILLILLLTGRL